MDRLQVPVHFFKNSLNTAFANKEPWQIATITATSVLFSVWIYDILFDGTETVSEKAKNTFFRWMKKIPAVRAKIDDEMAKFSAGFEKDIARKSTHLKYIVSLPEQSMSKEQILKTLDENLSVGEYDWTIGKVSGSVYYNSEELLDLLKEVYGMTSYTNPLHVDVFPGICKVEAEVIRIAAKLFNGDEKVCGTMTTGGTESILMACKAYRDYGRNVKGIKHPEMVLPKSAHSAFHKAALYFQIRVKYVPLDPNTYTADLKAMKRAISRNTVMLVGSAPNFPYGTIDNIKEISELGLKYNIPVHVDSCLGGFLTCFMDAAGYPVPELDFRLPGVTSISADTHKYGFAPKGTSLILYREKKYLHHQYTTTTDWPGGVYGSPTVNGSRAGGSIAACWATMLSFGMDGYVKATRDIIHTAKYIETGLRRIEGIYIFGQPGTSVIAIGSKVFDIYRLQGKLTSIGWNLNILQFPSGIHICVTQLHTKPGVADTFLKDVHEAVVEIMKDPGQPVDDKMAVYGYAQGIPDRSIVSEVTSCFLDAMYYTPKNNN